MKAHGGGDGQRNSSGKRHVGPRVRGPSDTIHALVPRTSRKGPSGRMLLLTGKKSEGYSFTAVSPGCVIAGGFRVLCYVFLQLRNFYN